MTCNRLNGGDVRAFGFGAELTIALSWPRVMESRSLLCKKMISDETDVCACGTDHDEG